MKKNNTFFLLFFIACKAQNYKVIHTSNNIINSIYYFHSNNEEFARVYGDNSPKDSLTFIKKGNDLIIEEFTIIEKKKKSNGNIRYVDYFSSVSDIISTGNPLFINEVPIINFNFIKKDLDLELLAKQNCHFTSNSYNHCDFILPKEDELTYLPTNSKIISINLTRKNNYLKNLISRLNIWVKIFFIKESIIIMVRN